ncbi:SDR family NAD(P)-dependent oxidoreductase [Cryptosporangium sp. NPDC048952]|uniref:SDR family NAD(P)-dependent oxidoreductase n=1 Tax=Cryptosporangium sp. NPDC048952 TaxID=3363961 RepID=UPI00372103FF
MDPRKLVAVVTGGGSGLGAATARHLSELGATVAVLDLDAAGAEKVAAELNAAARDTRPAAGGAGADVAVAVQCDVTDTAAVEAALDRAAELGPIGALVHCAGRGGPVRLLDRDGNPGDLAQYTDIVRVNLIGTFNMVRLTSARMARNPDAEERGVCVLTASVAAYEGQIGQAGYASSKAGIVGFTLVAARDLASRRIRVCSIAPGVFDTPMLARVPEAAREKLGASIPHPSRLGLPEEYASLAGHIIVNPMLNGETIRLDGALRMGPK